MAKPDRIQSYVESVLSDSDGDTAGGIELPSLEYSQRRKEVASSIYPITERTSALDFRGVDLLGVSLPDRLSNFSLLARHTQNSKLARNAFITLAIACLFFVLTVAQASDSLFVTNGLATKIPIIGVETPIRSFVLVTPILLTGIFLYFSMYTHFMVEAFSELPDVFPDGVSKFDSTESWLLNGLTFSTGQGRSVFDPSTLRIQHLFSVFAAYFAYPSFLIFVWIRILPVHDALLQAIVSIYIAISVGISIWFYLSRMDALANDRRFHRRLKWAGVTFTSVIAATGLSSALVFYDIAPKYRSHLSWFANVATQAGIRTAPDLNGATLVKLPEKWLESYRKLSERSQRSEFQDVMAQVSRVNFEGINFRSASATNTNLVSASLEGADLSEGDFSQSKADAVSFRGAKIHRAKFNGASLTLVDFSDAEIVGSQFRQGVRLKWSRFSNSQIKGVNFGEVIANGAHFSTARIEGTKFQNATLTGANFNSAQLTDVRFNASDLTNAKFRTAKLHNVDFSNAKLGDADFAQATMTNVKVPGAFLIGVTGLSEALLKSMCGDQGTQIDGALRLFLKNC